MHQLRSIAPIDIQLRKVMRKPKSEKYKEEVGDVCNCLPVWETPTQFTALLSLLVKITLQPTISRPVRLGDRRQSGTRYQFFYLLEIFLKTVTVRYVVVPSLMRGQVCLGSLLPLFRGQHGPNLQLTNPQNICKLARYKNRPFAASVSVYSTHHSWKDIIYN
jgi:hypothetical protein